MSQGNVAVDGRGPRRGVFRSIRTKLIVSFSLVFVAIHTIAELAGIMGVPFTPYPGRQRQQRVEAFGSLNLIADLKKDRLLRWIEERRNDGHVFANNDLTETNTGLLRATMRQFAAEGREGAELWALMREEESYRILLEFLDTVRSTYGTYNRIQIADAETGAILVSTDNADLGANVSHQPFFSEVLKIDYVSHITMGPSQRPALYFGHAIKDKEGGVSAALVMEVNADKVIKPMLHTGEDLGEKGEALLVNQDVRILTSLKHPLADGSTARPLEYQITAQPAVLAARGEEGIIESEDYRGEPVLAAHRHIRVSSERGWGMVVKQDEAELFAPLRQDAIYTFWIGLSGIVAVVGLTAVVARGVCPSNPASKPDCPTGGSR